MAEYNIASSLFNQNPNNLRNRAPFQPQNQMMSPYNNNYPLPLYQNNMQNPNQRMSQIQTPEDLNYYSNTMRQFLPPNYNQNDFFLQNFYDTNRIQNYEPKQFNRGFGNQIPDIDQKNLLMRKLEQLQRYERSFPPGNGVHNYNDFLSDPANYNLNQKALNIPQYQEYSRNHLSELFNRDYGSNYPSENSSYQSKRRSKTRQKKMFNLEKEKFSLEETLKALDSKFESGDISEIDYFKNFKNLQKEIYIIEKNIEALDSGMEDEEFLRDPAKEIDRKRYYT